MSQADQVLVALYRVAAGTTRQVPYEDLVIQAWRDYPESFSLRNHPEHPDASDIHKRLYSTLKKNGHVVSLGNKMFRLTEQGLDRARNLDEPSRSTKQASRQTHSRLSRTEEAFVRHALGTRTFAAWQSGRPDQIVDYDARVFFRFSTSTPVEDRRRRVEAAKSAVSRAAALGVDGGQGLDELTDYLIVEFGALLE